MKFFEILFYQEAKVLTCIQYLCSIGLILQSLELLISSNQFDKKNGCFPIALSLLENEKLFQKKWILICLQVLLNKIGVIFLLTLRLLSIGISLIWPLTSLVTNVALFFVLLSLLLLNLRNRYGGDGSDQMNLIVLTVLFISSVLNSEFYFKAGIFFIAFQLILSYFTAGFAKLISPKWRDGSAIQDIFNINSYSNYVVASILSKKIIAVYTSIFIITWEVFFPFSIFTNRVIFVSFLVIGLTFHVYNAVIMGLNIFLWSFISTYPAVIYLFLYFNK